MTGVILPKLFLWGSQSENILEAWYGAVIGPLLCDPPQVLGVQVMGASWHHYRRE